MIYHWLRQLRRLPHPTIVAIIAAAGVAFAFDNALGLRLFEDYGVVPVLVCHAWKKLVGGTVTANTAHAFLTIVTSLFLHGGPNHIVLNMVFLWTFGSLTSQFLGKWWALTLFFVCGASGSVLHSYLRYDSMIPTIGASGAVCGFEGVYLGLALRWQIPWPDVWPLSRPVPPMQLGLFAIVGIAADLYFLADREGGVAHGGHVGGFLAGLIVAVLITQVFPTRAAFQTSGWKR